LACASNHGNLAFEHDASFSDGQQFSFWLSLKADLCLAGSSSDRQFTVIRTGFALTGPDGAQLRMLSRSSYEGSNDAPAKWNGTL
jgi:hypothetical protein